MTKIGKKNHVLKRGRSPSEGRDRQKKKKKNTMRDATMSW